MSAGERRPSSSDRAPALDAVGAHGLGAGVLILWLVYLLIGPTIGFGWIESWHNEQRAVQIVLLVLTALAWYARFVLGQRGSSRPWSYPPIVLLFLGLGLASSAAAGFRVAAFAEVGLAALLVGLALFTASVVANDYGRALRWAQWFSLLFAAAYVLGVATRYLAAVNLERAIDVDVLLLGYANPRFPSALHALLIPFIAMLAANRSERAWLRVGAFVILALLWSINLALGTRAIWFAYALALPATAAIIGLRPLKRIAVVLGTSAALGVVFYFVLFHVAPTALAAGSSVSGPTSNTTLTSRDVIWSMGWDAIRSHPWLGIGPMQFAALGSPVGAHPHNWVLQIAAEWGVPAVWVVGYGLANIGSRVRESINERPGVAVPMLAVVAALTYGLVDGNLVMPISQSTFALAFGLLLGGVPVGETSSSKLLACQFVWVSAIVAVFSCGVVVAFATNSFAEQPGEASLFARNHVGAWLVPRFWEQGLIRP